MKIRTVAKNDKEVYAATDDKGNYYVIGSTVPQIILQKNPVFW
jgi:phosphatidate phosphatase APP1